ncbi:MAG: hypothetical protein KIT40_00425 [Nitrospira sp.]|nr:hypothetical protein [Nitrospira sp.]
MDLVSAEIGPILDLKHGEIKRVQGESPVATPKRVLKQKSRLALTARHFARRGLLLLATTQENHSG